MPRAVVLTISDTRSAGRNDDRSGPAVADRLRADGLEILAAEVIPDDRLLIESRLRHYLGRADLIVTTGGTGVGPRDVTPEAAAAVIEQPLPGFGEIMRTRTFDATPLAICSRGGAGVAGRTLIVCLPGSPRAVGQCLDLVLPAARHLVRLLAGGRDGCSTDTAPDAGARLHDSTARP